MSRPFVSAGKNISLLNNNGVSSSNWRAAAAAAIAAVDAARADVAITPNCSDEELKMLLEALDQLEEPAAEDILPELQVQRSHKRSRF